MKQMNKKRLAGLLAAFLVLAMTVALLAGCGKDAADGETTEAAQSGPLGNTSEGEKSAAEISEAAMDSFIDKIGSGNYVVECEANVFEATVASDDLVYYTFPINYGGDKFDGYALMTVNERETLLGLLGENGMERLEFAGEGAAFELAKNLEHEPFTSILPNSWIDEAGGNVWDLFYNDPEDPLKFTTNSDGIKTFIKLYAGIGDMVMPRMQEVYLELDAEDPTEAHVRTSFSEGYPAIADVDIVITFGIAEADERAVAWMNDEDRVMPEAKTEWGADEVNLNAVFLPGYGLTAVPFPDFATYALNIDLSRILAEDLIAARDCRATEDDMKAYAAKLVENGFEETEDEYGDVCYRLLLREKTKCYSSIYLDYDDGVNILAEKYYEFPKYEGRDEVNEVLASHGYPELPEKDGISVVSAVDGANAELEGWLYLFDFDLVLHAQLSYDDRAAAEEYMNGYVGSLEGFEPKGGETTEYDEVEVYLGEDVDITDVYKLRGAAEDDVYYKLKTDDEIRSFIYHFNEDGKTVTLAFKTEKYVSADEVQRMITEAGFSEADLSAYDSCRDLKRFKKVMYGLDFDLDLALTLVFETPEDATAYLDVIADKMLDDGFGKADPGSVYYGGAAAFVKEVGEGKMLLFGIEYKDGWAMANVEYRLMDVPEED